MTDWTPDLPEWAKERGIRPEHYRAACSIQARIFGPYQWQNQEDRSASMFAAIIGALQEQAEAAEAALEASRAREERLREALFQLANEASAWPEHVLIAGGGVTNTRVLQLRIEEARAVLAEASAADAPAGDAPDYLFDSNDWEFTIAWGDRDLLVEDARLHPGEMKAFSGLRMTAGAWAAHVILTRDEDGCADETEIRWFLSEAEAKAALAHDGETPGC